MSVWPDIVIENSQMITIGTQIVLSVELDDQKNRTFTVSAVVVDIFDEDGAAVSSLLTGIAGGSVAGLLPNSKIVQVTLTSALTNEFATDGSYYAIWKVTLSDSQTRRGKQSLKVRTVS